MQYIVLDMEWNQPWPGSPSARRVLPVSIHGEIIQIGAVRMDTDGNLKDEFQTLILPKYYRRLNSRVSKLTGIKESRLRREGLPFAEAIAAFRQWCGEDCVFLTWGFDDIPILKENIMLHGLNPDWVNRWFNAQMIFNSQTDGSTAQKALKTAMEIFGIEPSRPAHDALGDAYHTALICSRLDLQKGAAEYSNSLKSHEDGMHGAQLPGCVGRKVYHGFESKDTALSAMNEQYNLCPECNAQMSGSKWFAQQGRRYMAMMTCPTHGEFLIRIRLTEEESGTYRVSRLTYESASPTVNTYNNASQRAKRRTRRRAKVEDKK